MDSPSSSPSPLFRTTRGGRVSRKLHILALAAAASSIQSASAYTISGCYSSSKPLTYGASWNFQSPSWCDTNCAGSPVFGLEGGYDCWCGTELPPVDTLVDSSNCDVPCTGYGADMCGGAGFYTVYITDTGAVVPHYDPGNSNGGSGNSNNGGGSSSDTSPSPTTASASYIPTSSSSPTTTQAKTTTVHQKPSVITQVQPGTTVIKTTTPSSQASATPTIASTTSIPSISNNSSSNSTNVAAIAAGVSVGVIALACILGGSFYWLRRRRRHHRQIEETSSSFNGAGGGGHHHSTVGAFIRGPPSTAYSQMSDSRLEPTWGGAGAAGDRSSVGSLMDDRDYSRRILRVANPDSS